jgi:DNA helicase-2/ATP-dependent DNA helicase PcrA
MQDRTEIICGSPGCGKTTALLNILDEELERGTPPDRIGFFSFTKKAATEARDRACKRFNLKRTQLPYFRTLHSMCFNALGLSSSDVLDGKQLEAFGDWIGVKVSGKGITDEGGLIGFEEGDRCLFIENLARVRGVSLRDQYNLTPDNLPWELVERVARGLDHYKKHRHVHDFTDMITMFAQAEWPARLEVLFVDEAQDLSYIQWQAVARLSRGARRIVVAGDDDQAIYTWAGAAVDHFIGLPGTARVLGQSHRVPQAVQAVASDVVGRIGNRRPKAWAPRPEPGVVKRAQSLDDVEFAPGDDVLVLARNTCFLRKEAETRLRGEGILYEFKGQSSVPHKLVNAILVWERLRKGGRAEVREVEHVYEYMTAGAGIARGHKKLPSYSNREELVGLDELKAQAGLLTSSIWHEAMDRVAAEDRAYMIKCLRHGEKFTETPSTRLSTIHGAKGGEADHVVLLRDVARRSHEQGLDSPDDEARVFYVAATRARCKLTIVAPQTKRNYDI